MKRIGLIGGISWVSTLEYYRIINQEVNKKLGGVHSAELLIYSFEMDEAKCYIENENWKDYGKKASHYAKELQEAGAELIGICSNTGHNLVKAIEKKVDIPIIHIAEATAKAIKETKIETIALLGTKSTMIDDIPYNEILKTQYGINVLIPNEEEINIIQNIIMSELVANVIKENSRKEFQKIIQRLTNEGAKGVVLGCTEIPVLIKQEHCDIKVFDTTELHAKEIARFSLTK